ncbi:mitochondrial import inner membrane translocase subunit Tim44p [Trichomonascus vanleenenianus]|uniref:protein translocase subunit TIM44 n=1 Tax=Trichomonascus vanleenenianus TaxID=2268995 RepID=UPI003ECA0BA9
MQVFLDTFKTEWKKSKELQDDIKALQDETGRMSESAAFQRAKDAMNKAREGSSAASSVAGRGIRMTGEAVGKAVGTAWDSTAMKHTREGLSKTVDSLDKATEPIRKTELYKDIKNVIDDGSSMRYGGFEEKEARLRRREQEYQRRIEEAKRAGINYERVKANPEAGGAVEAHATAKPETKKWSSDFEKSTVGKKWADVKLAYEESENGLISSVRSVTDKIGSFFEETESARVVRMFKEMDPTFRQEEFLSEVRGYILPEVLDAYVKGNEEVLKMWLSEAPYNIWATSAKQYKEQGLFSAGRVLDIRGVDILNAKILSPSDVPVYVIGCRAQEIHMYKNVKTGEIAAGMEDHIQQSTYAMVLTRIPEEMENEETNGWKILELVRGQTREWT